MWVRYAATAASASTASAMLDRRRSSLASSSSSSRPPPYLKCEPVADVWPTYGFTPKRGATEGAIYEAARQHNLMVLPGSETDIKHRYVGTLHERSPRSLLLVPDASVRNIALFINEAIDFEGFSEHQEQEILEFSTIRVLEHLAKYMPNEYIRLVHTGHQMPQAMAKALQKNLTRLAMEVPMPYLDHQDHKRVCHCVAAVITMAMKQDATVKGGSIGDFNEHEKKKLLFHVFVKGVMEKFFDPEERLATISLVTEPLSQIPFLPQFVTNYAAHRAVHLVGDIIYQELEETYDIYLAAARARTVVNAIPQGYHGCTLAEDELETMKHRPFTALLRCRMCNILDGHITSVSRGCRLFPARLRARTLLFFMDKVFLAVNLQKLENTITMVVKPLGGHPPLFILESE